MKAKLIRLVYVGMVIIFTKNVLYKMPKAQNEKTMVYLFQVQNLNTSTTNIPNMETRILLENLTRIVKENEKLKQEVTEKTRKVEEQNDKISSLLQDNQRYAEISNQRSRASRGTSLIFLIDLCLLQMFRNS